MTSETPPGGPDPRGATKQADQPNDQTKGYLMSVSRGSDITPLLSRAEQQDLLRIVRQRAKLSCSQLEAHGARLLADFEAEVAAQYSVSSEAWADLTAAAKAACQAADAELARRCQELGVRPEFRPSISMSWYARGANADKERRTELRRVAQSRVAAGIKAAKVAISAAELEASERIIVTSLRGAAQEVLESIPTPADLLAPLDLDAIETDVPLKIPAPGLPW